MIRSVLHRLAVVAFLFAVCGVVGLAAKGMTTCNFPAGVGLDLRTAGAADWSTSGFVADANYPDVTADNLWQKWFWYIFKGQLAPGTRVFCGVTLPAFSTDVNLARAAAQAAGASYLSTDSAAAVCNKTLDHVGSPWSDP